MRLVRPHVVAMVGLLQGARSSNVVLQGLDVNVIIILELFIERIIN